MSRLPIGWRLYSRKCEEVSIRNACDVPTCKMLIGEDVMMYVACQRFPVTSQTNEAEHPRIQTLSAMVLRAAMLSVTARQSMLIDGHDGCWRGNALGVLNLPSSGRIKG